MSEKKTDSNLQWNKNLKPSSFSGPKRQKLKQALQVQPLKSRNLLTATNTNAKLKPSLDLRKMRKKIRDVFDDEENEDEESYQINQLAIEQEINPLLNALKPEERAFLKQKNTEDIMNSSNIVRNAEKLITTQQIAKELGLTSAKAKKILGDVNSPTENHVVDINLFDDANIKIKGNIKDLQEKDVTKLVAGIKKIKTMGGNEALEGMDIKSVIKAGEKKSDEKAIAKLINEKRGLAEEKEKTIAIEKKQKEKKIQKALEKSR